MDTQDFSRSKALNNIPARKLQLAIDAINGESIELSAKATKLSAINRYAESNIPIEYWYLKMDRDFTGDPRLLAKYTEYTADLKAAYAGGTSVCFAGKHGVGKQLSLETELPTPTGFVKLKDLKEGDQLFDEKGDICNVVKMHPINISPQSYEIEFDDGTKVEACADHLWLTYTRKDRRDKKISTIKSTQEILNTLYVGGKQKITNHSIKCSAPINYHKKDLPIDPYLFGLWIGDGDIHNGTIESADLEIFSRYKHHIIPSSIRNESKSVAVRVDGLYSSLRKLNFLKNKKCRNNFDYLEKYIPDEYLYSSFDQRLSLLQGILDTDGSCAKDGGIEYCTVIPKLAEQVCQLVKSLGIKTKIKINESWLYNKQHKNRYRITFSTKLQVFRLKRKLTNIRLEKNQLTRTEHRFIINIKEILPKPMRCITVDSPSHLFLITRSFIATHNTMVSTCILKRASLKGFSCLYTTASDIVNVLIQGNNDDKYLAKRELAMVDFLAIDELDIRFFNQSELSNELFGRSLEPILRSRLQNKLPILIGTNSPNIKESFASMFKASLDSLMSKIEDFSVMPGKDFRKEKPSMTLARGTIINTLPEIIKGTENE